LALPIDLFELSIIVVILGVKDLKGKHINNGRPNPKHDIQVPWTTHNREQRQKPKKNNNSIR